MQQTKLMVLGASAAQLPMIRKAVELGCYVITVDNVPGNIGHQLSQQAIYCSTIDRIGVLKIAQTLDINGIVTFASDVATATVAYVAEQMDLIACSLKVAETMSNKAHFRRFQQANNLTHPDFIIIEPQATLDNAYLTLTPPLIFKPVDTSGSRGITKVDGADKARYQQAFNAARNFARSGVVSVETFMEGIDVSGDGFLLNGQLCAIVTQKYKQGFIPAGHSFPTQLSLDDQARVFEEVTKTCQALGYRDGPVDFDVNISAEHVVVIEMSPRLGGNGIPELIRRSTGVDLMDLTIRYALGSLSAIPDAMVVNQRSGSWVFGVESGGQLEHIASAEEIYAEVPALFELVLNYQIGDTVPPFEHSGNCVGFALFDCPPRKQYEDMVSCLQTALQLRVKVN